MDKGDNLPRPLGRVEYNDSVDSGSVAGEAEAEDVVKLHR